MEITIGLSCFFFIRGVNFRYIFTIHFCPQEATAEEVEFDDEEVIEEVDDNKDY